MRQVKAIKTFTSTKFGNVVAGQTLNLTDEEFKRLADVGVIEGEQKETKSEGRFSKK